VNIQASIVFDKKETSIKRALISVYDKTGLAGLATALHKQGVTIVSTGGSARFIRKAGIPVEEIEDLTGIPEMLNGRLKSLHPIVHGGLLARQNYKKDMEELSHHNILPFQLLVVNLYPFQEVIKKDITIEDAMENIDIGGPAMIRSAAKNVDHLCVLTEPESYDELIDKIDKKGTIDFNFRLRMAHKAFLRASVYDTAISNYLLEKTSTGFPEALTLNYPKFSALRYGENPHQAAAVYGKLDEVIDVLHGRQLSYNNFLDVDAAVNIIRDFNEDDPTVAIIKHTIPSGIATAESAKKAWQKAYATDTMSPFGGVVAINRILDLETAKEIDTLFTEIIIAPGYEEDALALLKKKEKRRLLKLKNSDSAGKRYTYRSVLGGILCQQPDNVSLEMRNLRTVTKIKPTEEQIKDLLFAWKVVKRVNSNAVVYASNLQTLGIGSGQPSRVDASEFAVFKANKYGHSLEGSVIASDAFFPFADGIEAAAKAGAKAIIQPGGSIRDDEVINAANKHGMAMIFTGIRHFKH
jgi:phosphoribosylaminoimidazolecarboxamide formyltransferase/IMP cyclohydrolase